MKSLMGMKIEPELSVEGYIRPEFDDHHKQTLINMLPPQMKTHNAFYTAYSGHLVHRMAVDVDIDHLVPLDEAYRSGVRGEDLKLFANDKENHVLVMAHENRSKGSRDVGTWLPPINIGWYVWRWVYIKRKWGMTVDERESEAICKELRDAPKPWILRPTEDFNE